MQFAKEGEELSKKQLALESSSKKLRAQLKEAEQSCKDTETNLLIQRQQVRGAVSVHNTLDQSDAVSGHWTKQCVHSTALSAALHAAWPLPVCTFTVSRQPYSVCMQAEASSAAQKRAEADAAAAAKAHEAAMAAEKEHYSGLLQKARASQVHQCPVMK